MQRMCFFLLLVALGLPGCSTEPACGPQAAVVARVIDGDTVELSSGERIRYLLVDTPELARNGTPAECFATEATRLNSELVLGRQIALRYDAECTDQYGRLLAYVSVRDVEVNALLIERGYGCVLYVPPNGSERVDALKAQQSSARAARRGMWGACMPAACP